jgi:hypothetical protein
VNATLSAALDRVKLLAGCTESPLLSVQVRPGVIAILPEMKGWAHRRMAG